MHPERTGPTPTSTSTTPEDHFDAWLDAFVAGPSTPAATASPSPGMPSEPAFDAARSAARQLHDLAQAADLAQSRVHPSSTRSPVPTWEELLMSSPAATTTTTPMPVPIPFPAGRTRRSRHATMETINRILTIAAVVAILLAGIATAWVARDRLGFGDDGQQPTLQLVASPASTVTCTTRTLSQEEASRIAAAYREPTLADYTLTDKPVPEADALAAIATYHADGLCPKGDPGTDNLLWLYSTRTDRIFSVNYRSTSPAWMAGHLQHYRDLLEPMSRILAPLPPTSYVVDRDDPAIGPYLYNSNSAGYRAILPSRFVQLADGRIGVPIVTAVTGGATANTDYSAISVSFIIFVKVDGTWLIDDAFSLCPGDCGPAERRLDAQIANLERLATVIGSPSASPEATPQT